MRWKRRWIWWFVGLDDIFRQNLLKTVDKYVQFFLLLLGMLMHYLKQSVLSILLWSLALYLIAFYLPWLGFTVQSNYDNVFVIFLFLGVLSWICNVLVKGVLRLLTLPLSLFTLWLFGFVLNFLLLYVYEQFVNFLALGVTIHLGNVQQVFVLSCILSTLYLLLKKIK